MNEANVPDIPHSRTAEEALIGGLLINPDGISTVNLKPHEFYIHRHGFIYKAMRQLNERGIAIDLVTLSEELSKLHQLEEIGGQSYLTSLITQSPNSYNLEYYAGIIRDKSQRRNDLKIANMIAEGAFNGGVDRAKAVDMLTQNANTGRGSVPLSSGLDEFYMMVEKRAEAPRDIWGIPTGLPDLDTRIGGLQKQQTLMLVWN